jgi:hypothetical protein
MRRPRRILETRPLVVACSPAVVVCRGGCWTARCVSEYIDHFRQHGRSLLVPILGLHRIGSTSFVVRSFAPKTPQPHRTAVAAPTAAVRSEGRDQDESRCATVTRTLVPLLACLSAREPIPYRTRS